MIAILTDPTIGGTFLTWSIYYLSGRTQYYSIQANKAIELTDSPLSSRNAHGFKPNQLKSANDVDKHLPTLLSKPDEHVYMHQHQYNTKNSIDQVCAHASKIVVLSLSKDQQLYQCKYNQRGDSVQLFTNKDSSSSDPDQIYQDFVEFFFKDSAQVWKEQKLTSVWDQREFMALNFDPFAANSILNYIDTRFEFHNINAMDVWTNFDKSVDELFEFLGWSIDPARYQSWLPIYNQWKNLQTDRLRFIWYFDTIINCILQGSSLDLTRFDLDIQQEAAIQHVLIYKHNLNLKTWQLDKFINTKQLHNLLEENIHVVKDNAISKRLTA